MDHPLLVIGSAHAKENPQAERAGKAGGKKMNNERKDPPVITQINRINTQLHSPLGIFNTLNTL